MLYVLFINTYKYVFWTLAWVSMTWLSASWLVYVASHGALKARLLFVISVRNQIYVAFSRFGGCSSAHTTRTLGQSHTAVVVDTFPPVLSWIHRGKNQLLRNSWFHASSFFQNWTFIAAWRHSKRTCPVYSARQVLSLMGGSCHFHEGKQASLLRRDSFTCINLNFRFSF